MGSTGGFTNAKLAVFKIDNDAGSIADISAYVTEVDGLPGTRRMHDVTGLTDSGMRSHVGLQDITVRVSGLADGSTSGAGAYLRYHFVQAGQGATVSFEYGPEGAVTGAVKYSGECRVSELTFPSRVGNIQTFAATLPVDGTITIAETW